MLTGHGYCQINSGLGQEASRSTWLHGQCFTRKGITQLESCTGIYDKHWPVPRVIVSLPEDEFIIMAINPLLRHW